MARQLTTHGQLFNNGNPQLDQAPNYAILITPTFWFPFSITFYLIQLIQCAYLLVIV
ncbi:hypothetical protein [Poriferisphaera corsica]|uniref:hypothetical protein n=1 Tax=Poriferisphaera corsica TaxID=2528020 RepID=UPI00190A4881|nr:hypothetical protein [Poriferisphaera corsica]